MAYITETTGDASPSADTTYTMAPGDTFAGRLDERSDEDWVRVELEAGLRYQISLAGAGSDGAADTILRIYDAGGQQVAMNDDVDRAAGNLGSELRFSPESSGVYYISAGSYSANPNRENWGDYRLTVFTLGSADVITGTDGPDVMTGTEGDDEFEGSPGADTIRGGPGNDLVYYQHSDMAIEVRLHDGTARGGDAEGDTFPGRQTIEYLDEDGNLQQAEVSDIENLRGSEYGNILTGSQGPNRLEGLGGDDDLSGLEGDDVLAGDFRNNFLNGLAGDDLLYGGPDGGHDFMFGGYGNDQVYGGKGYDWLFGGHGDDLLKGGPGNDTLELELEQVDEERSDEFTIHFKKVRYDYGDDRLEGGAGDDFFYFYPDGGDDTILDFGNGADRIVLTAFEDIQSVDDLTLQQQGNDLVIDLSPQGGGTITLQDYDEADLMDSHLVFHAGESATVA